MGTAPSRTTPPRSCHQGAAPRCQLGSPRAATQASPPPSCLVEGWPLCEEGKGEEGVCVGGCTVRPGMRVYVHMRKCAGLMMRMHRMGWGSHASVRNTHFTTPPSLPHSTLQHATHANSS